MEMSPYLEYLSCSAIQEFQHFMEHEGSLPCSEKSSTGPYHKPD
jgi:hypothetical protein